MAHHLTTSTVTRPDTAETALVRRVLAALLREDHLGLRSRGRLDGDRWRTTLPDGRPAEFTVVPDGFLAEHAAVALDVAGRPVRRLTDLLDVLAPDPADAEATAGWAGFAAECGAALDAARDPVPADPPGPRTGYAGLLRYDALAAVREHPVHPTGRARPGLDAAARAAYAPEQARTFPLHWRFVPRADVQLSPALATDPPGWWPSGTADTIAVPVHPLTGGEPLGPLVVPTLSMRTLALAGDPRVHVKVPLPTATLGLRNRRTIKPGTLADGAAMHELLAAVLTCEPELAARIRLADESRYLHGPDEHLAAMVRVLPADIATGRLVPLAALPVRDPRAGGPTVLEELAAGDVPRWCARYLAVLLDWHVALWVRYGIALESHQQNITIAQQDGAPLRLVYKDDDGARVDAAHAAAALGRPVPAFTDPRMLVTDPAELADLFVTITLHLCVRALLPVSVLPEVRDRIADAADRFCDRDHPRSVAARAAVHRMLTARRWPVKAMVTSGTLLPKTRLNCTDVNKYVVRTGPNYLANEARPGFVLR
ncbi:IucA/IucC family protein [Pseudonocardia thermophila]|uniref:IucA/IucC family protein n=1 Tax=Pseudonocardia thermophila TaxID=1848 RepID=UPI00248E8942|nr:IucA/IucC family protein [Pseudonocardia thermophila]